MYPPNDISTEEEYLVREPQAEYRSEFRDGRVVAMSGPSIAHGRIVVNLIREIDGQLKGRPCATYPSDTRIKVAAAKVYTYPDLSVVCGKAVADTKDPWAIVNPTLIVEVLSPSTEAYDRGEKFAFYKKIESLREYVLVSQNRIQVERFSRQENGQWDAVKYVSLDDSFDLPAIGCRVSLRDVYDKVEMG